MKVLLVNGSPNEKGCTYTALSEVAGALQAEGVETEIVHIGNGPVYGCTGCYACRKTGRCKFDDVANAVAEKLRGADGLVLGSPVYFAGPNGALCAVLDRVFYSTGGHAKKPGAAVVSCRRAGSTAALDRLNKYFSIHGMPIVGSQYWNMVHGKAPDEVRQDEEGLQIMRTLGKNMAWLLKSVQAGNVPRPTPEEKKMRTSFIR